MPPIPDYRGSNGLSFPSMMKLRAAHQPVSFLALLAAFGAISASGQGQDRAVPNPQLASKEINSRVESLLKQMTLEEKIGQTVQYAAGFATGPSASKLT